ncbi:M20 metallopeptidase family protein [Collinsella tanakaei]|uniref:M20 metallopeptidase family protein n=1 Tax=Collinsella tanakaei TaxID=626935 RepID=UPI0025A4ADBE|nr:M20 family metallopeptidase [Collinsella tanakaei]MDM8302731.1 M20 family metallopeptidase [Collinsella tanakaei]
MKTIIDEAKALQETIVEDRRWLHRHPEIGFDLPQTQAYVRERLEAMGYEVSVPCDGGLLTQVGDPASGPCILLRADYDALPVEEATGLPFASDNGNMHACGHDTHAAMLLGAARILKDHEAELKGCVKLLFQPDEEGCAPVDICGGDAVLAGGVLENPHVDAVTALHVQAIDFESGVLYTREGTIFSSIDDIDVEITGKGAHGSTPHMGIDPINIACHIYEGFQNLIAREVDPTQVCVATFGKIEAGRAANVLPETAHMLGTLRTQDAEVRQSFKEHAERMVAGIADAFGGEAAVRFLRGVPNTYNDPELTAELSGYADELFGEPVQTLAKPFSGTDDLAILSQVVPTTYFILGTGTLPGHEGCGMHHPNVDFDESVFWKGTALLANSAIEYLAHRAG